MLEAIAALFHATSVADLRDKTGSIFRSLGFQASYYIAPLSAERGPMRLMTNAGFPLEWETAYRATNNLYDPLPDIALSAAEPILWGHLPDNTLLQEDERHYLETLEAWNMQQGVGIVTYGPLSRLGFVGVGLPVTPEIGETPDIDLLRITAQTSFLRYCELIADEVGELPELSKRELEVLNRIAQGKSKTGIAREMQLSKDTVDTYFRRIYAKLDVSDRGAAVAKAVARGLMITGEAGISAVMMRRHRKASLPRPEDGD
ncbi:helix-turn-helix transcriptional regulator [Henriciella aquimarina]|uniref:helix-turn-helix transcriptional regulator n=1 Tax=Henriciella aquimarina TaxID=545261 RepID=UPI001301ADCB|nr:LuxR family transcriptional regulator [Henriciella aquimarina]